MMVTWRSSTLSIRDDPYLRQAACPHDGCCGRLPRLVLTNTHMSGRGVTDLTARAAGMRPEKCMKTAHWPQLSGGRANGRSGGVLQTVLKLQGCVELSSREVTNSVPLRRYC